MYGWQDIFSGCVLAAAFCAAASARAHERREAMLCAAMLIAVWLNYTASWNADLNLSIVLTKHGMPIRTAEMWTLVDMAAGLIALFVAWRFWWGLALYGSFMVETLAHWFRWQIHLMDRVPYYWTLDACFYAQAALLLTIGGPRLVQHISERVSDFIGNRRRILRLRRHVSPTQAIDRG